jgi:hypothetical protein
VTDVLDLIGEELQNAAQRLVRSSHRNTRGRLTSRSLRGASHDGRWRWRGRPLALVFVLCLGGGTVALAATGAFPTNGNGQTYGSSAGDGNAGPVIQDQVPDLILATGTPLTGTGHLTGYILNSQLNAVDGLDEVTNPAQAVVWDQAHTGPNATPVSVPLYAQDGTTVIGTVTIGGPTPTPMFTTSATGTTTTSP